MLMPYQTPENLHHNLFPDKYSRGNLASLVLCLSQSALRSYQTSQRSGLCGNLAQDPFASWRSTAKLWEGLPHKIRRKMQFPPQRKKNFWMRKKRKNPNFTLRSCTAHPRCLLEDDACSAGWGNGSRQEVRRVHQSYGGMLRPKEPAIQRHGQGVRHLIPSFLPCVSFIKPQSSCHFSANPCPSPAALSHPQSSRLVAGFV